MNLCLVCRQKFNLTSVVISHDVEIFKYADYVALFYDGVIKYFGDAKTIWESTIPMCINLFGVYHKALCRWKFRMNRFKFQNPYRANLAVCPGYSDICCYDTDQIHLQWYGKIFGIFPHLRKCVSDART